MTITDNEGIQNKTRLGSNFNLIAPPNAVRVRFRIKGPALESGAEQPLCDIPGVVWWLFWTGTLFGDSLKLAML